MSCLFTIVKVHTIVLVMLLLLLQNAFADIIIVIKVSTTGECNVGKKATALLVKVKVLGTTYVL